MAKIVSAKLPYGNIERYCDNEKISCREAVKPKQRFAVRCNCCGQGATVKGYRAPTWYAHIEDYRCSACGGKLEKC